MLENYLVNKYGDSIVMVYMDDITSFSINAVGDKIMLVTCLQDDTGSYHTFTTKMSVNTPEQLDMLIASFGYTESDRISDVSFYKVFPEAKTQ